MDSLYARWMKDWENRLCFRATNRVVRPFDWGLEWTSGWPAAQKNPRNGHTPAEYLRVLNEALLQSSHEFFAYRSPSDFELDGKILRFTSPVKTPYPENNIVHGQWYPAVHKPGKRKVAVLVLPHWNASAGQHGALCAGMAKLGMSALRLSLPYHDKRMPAELTRADYAVSANVARTLDATRQAVIDVRSCFDWLQLQGYEDLGIVGTSLGSCYGFLASAHDERIRVNVFNHCSTRFGDVVWEGLSTRHIRRGLEGQIDVERLRQVWDCTSPVHYMDRFSSLARKSFFLYATYDTTFLPVYSRQVVEHVRQRHLDHKLVVMPCGHYTLGETPFKFVVGYQICAFLKRNL